MFLNKALSVALCVALTACQPEWISPYSADLQKRATDMLANVTAWEMTMAQASTPSAVDPSSAATQAKLAGWVGDVEAMAAVEASIDPDSAGCDRVLNSIGGGMLQSAESKAESTGATDIKGSAPLSIKCESLPDIFARMRVELVQRIPLELSELCKPEQSPARFINSCQSLFKPTASLGLKARHGVLLSPLIGELTAVIYREGRQAPKTKQ